MKIELKPCPSCGTTEQTVFVSKYGDSSIECSCGWCVVVKDDGCTDVPVGGILSRLIMTWNTRAVPTEKAKAYSWNE